MKNCEPNLHFDFGYYDSYFNSSGFDEEITPFEFNVYNEDNVMNSHSDADHDDHDEHDEHAETGNAPLPVNVSSSAEFRTEIYDIFRPEIRKILPGKIIRAIHKIIYIEAKVPKIDRECLRSIGVYFETFAQYKDQIINTIKNKKQILIEMIPELKTLINKRKL